LEHCVSNATAPPQLARSASKRVVGGRACEVPAKPKRGDQCGEQRQAAGTSQARRSKALLTALAFKRMLVMYDQAKPAFL